MDSRLLPDINEIIIMGDSLSDRGELDHKNVFCCIPFRLFTDLSKSPQGRFTNGKTWDDNVSAMLASQFTIKKLEKKANLAPTDIADDIIDHERNIEHIIHRSYNLNNYDYVKYDGRKFVRSGYCEGGLTAYNWDHWKDLNLKAGLKEDASRLILSNLEAKRKELLNDDIKSHRSEAQKNQTLVIEWSGANDLITVNKSPSREAADKAVAGRIENARELIKNGYRHFILFNLPDLSLTPLIQALSPEEQTNASSVCTYFNEQLQEECQKLRAAFPDCVIDIFDINTQFTQVYNHSEQYGFDQDKLKIAYNTSSYYNKLPDGAYPSMGFMFWDGEHPSAAMHAILASKFCDAYLNKYNFVAPEEPHASLRVSM